MPDRRDADQQKMLTRRTLLLAGLKGGLLAALVGRLYYLQVLQSDQYKVLSDENRISVRLLPPPRGRILDRFGVELASNRRNYRALIVPERTDDVKESLERLSAIISIDDNQRARILREIQRKRKFMPVVVAENLPWEDFARINLQSPELPGILVDIGETRDYNYGSFFTHIIGYVGAVSEKELSEDDPLLELPGFRIGKQGIEKIYDLDLRGKAGDTSVEVNAYGRVIRELHRREGQPGDDIVLTIDAELQKAVTQRVKDESAAVVVMDVRSGEVLALVSNPSYDPNPFNVGISSKEWQALNNNKLKPLLNKTISGVYPPGSTFKMVVGLAGLEAGAITADTRISCPGHYDFGDNRFHCWRPGGHGSMTVHTAIEESCDVFFYEVARRIGPDRIADMARRFGLGEQTGIDLANEKPGVAPTRAWKKQALKKPWYEGETINVGIGQGYVLVTPLQLAVMTSRLATNKQIKPRLVVPDDAPAEGVQQVSAKAGGQLVNPAFIKIVQDGMKAVTGGPRGTAFKYRLPAPTPNMAGKTGTAQVRRITMKERENKRRKEEDLPWEERHHGWFVAYVPVDEPRYAVSVLVEHGGASGAAAAVARDVLVETMRLDPANRPGRARFAAESVSPEKKKDHG